MENLVAAATDACSAARHHAAAMDTELSMEFELEIKGAPAEREEDLKQLLEGDFNGGQPAAPLDPITYMNEREEDLKQVLEEDFEINGGQPAAPFGPPTYMDETTRDAAPATMQPEREGLCAASTVGLIGRIPKIDWSCKRPRRGPRKRRIPLCMDRGWFLGNHFGGRNSGHRTNKPRWTTKEVFKLIDGLEEYGARSWSEIKKKYFSAPVRTADNLSAPVRTADNLKDKWRNLRKSYTGNAETKCHLDLPKNLVERIQMLAHRMHR